MYAIVVTGGKQVKAEKGRIIDVEKIDAEVGTEVELPVLLISDGKGSVKTGADVKDAKVKAAVVRQDKGPKIIVYKYKPKKNIRKRQGHRQPYTALKVLEIVG